MADGNLLEVLSKEQKLDNMIVYGKVRCAINKPEFLSNNVGVTEGFFALVDVLAFKCNGVDYFNQSSDNYDSKHIYFSKGSLVVVLDDKKYIGEGVRIYGRTLKGCTIKKNRTKSSVDGIVGFAWTKQNGQWLIVPNKVQILGQSDIRGTVLEDYIVSLVGGIKFTHPKSTEAFIEYKGVEDVKPLSVSDIKGCVEYTNEYIDLSEIPLNLTYRLEAKEESGFVGVIGEELDILKDRSQNFATSMVLSVKSRMVNENKEEGIRDINEIADSIIDGFINGIASKYNYAISSNTKLKGKDIVDEFLDNLLQENFRSSDEEEKATKKPQSDLFKDIEKLKKSVALDPHMLDLGRSTVPILGESFKYASLIIAEVTGVGYESIVSNHNTIYNYNGLGTDEWFWCLMRNPYICGLLGSSLSIVDCDRIFCSFSEPIDKEECNKYRNILLMLDTIKSISSRSTLVKLNQLYYNNDVYPSLGKRYIEHNGAPMSKDCIVLSKEVSGRVRKISLSALNVSVNPKHLVKELNDIGLVELINDDGVILSKDLYKEYTIYTTLLKKGRTPTGITKEEVEKTVAKFEESRGFKLEKLQKDGVQLVMHKAGVLSGCAGSGKTTTSDCLVDCIKDYLPDYELKFGAPTGKAARRLAEVVGGNVKTIHSMFGLGLDSEPYITKKDRFFRKSDESSLRAYILDEMAMSNTSLMYEIVNHLEGDDLVYFLGDIKQLSPIGKGSPFRSLMKFLPCVELGVSKRAAANGKINYNCGLINFVSDERVVELQSGDDFEIVPCKDSDIQSETVAMFERMLKDFDEDDIQVVTGYQTDKYPWSTVQLNPLLQNLLRNDTDFLYVYNDSKFMRNDRVIHTKRNAYDMPRFRKLNNSTYEEVVTFGIVNGELGKIVGYIKSSDCTIFEYNDKDYSDEEWAELDKDTQSLILYRRNTSVNIRDENSYKDENLYFVIIEVYDVDLKENVYIFYHSNYRENLSNDYYTRVFTGGDLRYLDLAYALTTHKMQGSQSPAIIIPLGSTSSPQFMNRNMLNTMITRASKKVGLIGSVKGKGSALTNGRRLTNIEDGEDVLSILVE